MKQLIYLSLSIFLLFACTEKSNRHTNAETEGFTFVFMTDVHISTEHRSTEGFKQAIDTINSLNPDFVLSGGDNINDALALSYEASDSVYKLFVNTAKNLKSPFYSTMGNHEVFGLYEASGVSPSHEEYGKQLYQNRIAKRYYSFDHKNWHFVVLDGIGLTEDRHYYGHVDEEQLEWLKADLEKAGKKPIAVSIHMPLFSIGSQIMQRPTAGMAETSIVTNANQVREILEQYNTKVVFQGHLHFLEDIEYNGIHYITGGAVCSQWWQGKRFGLEEGFLKVDVNGEDFSWNYIDYGWEVQ
ncbi:MAG TPA: metallophosphoesterase [Draconibacterium sp.]|nr:metallophosphoesterase [Draconibacterium sp.]